MTENSLTRQQQHVLTLLAHGSTVAAAAAATGVHRNTVANWRRGAPPVFYAAVQTAQSAQAAYWRDNRQSLINLAIANLQQIAADDRASSPIRRKARIALLKFQSTEEMLHCAQRKTSPPYPISKKTNG